MNLVQNLILETHRIVYKSKSVVCSLPVNIVIYFCYNKTLRYIWYYRWNFSIFNQFFNQIIILIILCMKNQILMTFVKFGGLGFLRLKFLIFGWGTSGRILATTKSNWHISGKLHSFISICDTLWDFVILLQRGTY